MTRVTVDLTPQANERLDSLVVLVGAASKAHVIRHAIHLYEYVAGRALDGWTFQAVSGDGRIEDLVFLELPQAVKG